MSCQKVPYENRADATADAKLIHINQHRLSRKYRRAPKNGKALSPYQCRYCNKWHLTSQSQHKKY